MRTLAFLFIAALALPGQQQTTEPPKPEAQAPVQEAKPEGQAAEAGKTARDIEAENAQKLFYGTVDLGWRFRSDVGGDFNTYRSVVNQGEGPSLLNADVTFQGPDLRLFDRMRIMMNSWGPEPFRTARVDMDHDRYYRFRFDFRDLAYFNFLPSYANPFRDQGVFATQRGFDITRRSLDGELTLFPLSHFVPFVSYSRGSGDGRGVSNLVLNRNEFTLPTRISDRADIVRGGIRFEFNRFHATLEGGKVNYRDEQELFPGSGPNAGNTTAPVFGQPLVLQRGYQALGVRGDSAFARVLVTANPFSWINVTGAFMFSQPESDINLAQAAAGTLAGPASLIQGQLLLATARSIQPHPSGNFTVELRPLSRLRVFESFTTDRFHTAGTALLIETLFAAGGTQPPFSEPGAERLVLDYNQNELNVLFDVTRWLIVRGGHKYVWSEADTPASIPAEFIGLTRQLSETKRQSGLAGLTVRPNDRFSLNFDFEGASSDASYFRTSLHDYQRARIQAKFQPLSALQLTARFSVLDNNRPRPNYTGLGPQLDYDFLSRDNSLTVYWTPANGKYFSFLADYSRSTYRSETDFLNPAGFAQEPSVYWENAHIGTALVEVPIAGGKDTPAKISFGGSFYRGAGSRPSRYYQPMGSVSVPAGKWVELHADWRWYGLTQPLYLFEGFRTHTFVTGLRFKL